MQNAGKTIVYQDYRDRNGSGSRSGSANRMKYGKPTGTPQGAVVISPAQLRAKSLNNTKHLKRRSSNQKKKNSPSSGR